MPAVAAVLLLVGISLLGLADQAVAAEPLEPSGAAAKTYAVIPANKDDDLKFYAADGRITKGADALAQMRQDAGLILWVAGNQFFAMDTVIDAFQTQNGGIAVGLVTLPPGLLLEAILKGGWSYQGRDYPGQPDIYASVSLEHLQRLKRAGLMDDYLTYMHNEMVL